MKKKISKIEKLERSRKRALADYANLEKRVAKERKEFVKFSSAILLDKLLAVFDSLEQAEKHLKDKGLTMAVDQLKMVLETEGVAEIKARGREFDAEEMDCVEVVEGKKNKVVKVMQKGYKLNGRILRPAKVKVGGLKNG